MNEKTLYQAFDLQRFEPEERLQAVIDETHKRLEKRASGSKTDSDDEYELSDEGLDYVSAAGELDKNDFLINRL